MNRKIKKPCEYHNYYRESKKQIKEHICRALCTDREHLKKKDYFNKRKYTERLYQRRFNEKIISAKN